jgi:hypothetical protein
MAWCSVKAQGQLYLFNIKGSVNLEDTDIDYSGYSLMAEFCVRDDDLSG